MLTDQIVNNVATLGKLGYWGKAPGTSGSVAGLILYTVCFFNATPVSFFLLILIFIYLSIAFCHEAERRMQKKDPGEVILDEVVAMPLCFIGTGYIMETYPVWLVLLVGFGLFRFFDILKPLGIAKLQDLEGGLGIVVDDLAAAAATCVCLHVLYLALS